MSQKIKFACVVFPKEGSKVYTISVDNIYVQKKDLSSIKPKSIDDFDESAVFYIYWPVCGKKDCTVTKKCCTFYKGQIKSLGGRFLLAIL